MSSKGILRTGFCAFSLSLSLLAGCASPVVPTPATGGDVPAPAAQAPGETPAVQPAPAAPAPAALTPVTLAGQASFRGEALSGYDVTVLDAQTGKAVERKADLAGVTTLAVLDKNLKTDASGAFSFQVVGLKPGQALRVQIRQGNGLLETIVTSDLQALGAKKLQLLQATGNGLSINELTTAIAKIARGVLTTTQVLSAEAAAPVLAQLATEMASLSVKLDAAFKANPNLANNLVSTQGKESEAVNALVSSAGALKEVTQAVARLVSQVAKSSAAAPATTNPEVQAALSKVEFIGTVLTGAFSTNGFQLSNSATGQSVDAASGDIGSVSSNVSGSSSGSSSGVTLTAEQAAGLAAINAVSITTTASSMPTLETVLGAHHVALGLTGDVWTKFLALYDGATGPVVTSGRQQAVLIYLHERVNKNLLNKNAEGKSPYTSLAALQTDFAAAVNKETAKKALITGITNGTSASAALALLDTHLPTLKADFDSYVTWRDGWVTDDLANLTWTMKGYFVGHSDNIGAFLALNKTDSAALREHIATAVATNANGSSDVRLLTGLKNGLGLFGALADSQYKLANQANQQAILGQLIANEANLATADWTKFVNLFGGQVALTSGRQQAVAAYLLERVHQRSSGVKQPYVSIQALQADFHTAVNKETTKKALIDAIAAAKANNNDTAAAVTALTTHLGALQTDFNDYLTWHADWTVPNETWAGDWKGQTAYFAVNSTNIGAYLSDSADKTAIATKVLHASNGTSDMAILNGLRPAYTIPAAANYRVGR